MRIKNIQGTFADSDEAYAAFEDKFKTKKTTDDCLTPDLVYDAVLAWVRTRYGIDEARPIVRPFWPGEDYRRRDYPERCVVVDNPPFSILSRIAADYLESGIDFFLFAPALTFFSMGLARGCGYVVAGCTVTYANGAKVATSFVTSLGGENLVEVRPDLREAVEAADAAQQKAVKGAPLPKYEYPVEVATAARLSWLAAHGTAYTIRREDAAFIRQLDAQKGKDKTLFGGGFILSERAAAERAAAERAAAERAAAERAAAIYWPLSDRERLIQRALSGGAQP